MEKPKYSDIYDFENLYQGAHETINDRRYYPSELRFTDALEENLIEQQNELVWHTYTPGDGKEFLVFDPKERLIYAPNLRDRIIQTAACRVLEPHIDPRLDFDSYACREGKGPLAAANRAAYFANRYSHFAYFDVSKFFDSISVPTLEDILHSRFIDDAEIMWLLHTVYMQDCNGVGVKKGCRTSQMGANVYLNELDHFLRHTLKVKAYVRYMDDFIIFSDDVGCLKYCWQEVAKFLQDVLFLKLNPKTYIGNTSNGFEFVGYMIFPNYKIVRKLALNRATTTMKAWKSGKISDEDFYRSTASRVGHCKGTASYKWFCEYLLKAMKFACIDRPELE